MDYGIVLLKPISGRQARMAGRRKLATGFLAAKTRFETLESVKPHAVAATRKENNNNYLREQSAPPHGHVLDVRPPPQRRALLDRSIHL